MRAADHGFVADEVMHVLKIGVEAEQLAVPEGQRNVGPLHEPEPDGDVVKAMTQPLDAVTLPERHPRRAVWHHGQQHDRAIQHGIVSNVVRDHWGNAVLDFGEPDRRAGGPADYHFVDLSDEGRERHRHLVQPAADLHGAAPPAPHQPREGTADSQRKAATLADLQRVGAEERAIHRAEYGDHWYHRQQVPAPAPRDQVTEQYRRREHGPGDRDT